MFNEVGFAQRAGGPFAGLAAHAYECLQCLTVTVKVQRSIQKVGRWTLGVERCLVSETQTPLLRII
jgi:hypothetical protein